MARGNGADTQASPNDLAARAAWLSFVGGLTQDQIAQELGISRQRAQRLVARAAAEGLVRVRIDHPIAACLELERDLRRVYGLTSARVAPSLGSGGDALAAIAPVAAPELERIFSEPEPKVIALGTGRTLRAAVEDMQPVDGRQHKVVSLIGNVAPDGSASLYDVIMRIADKTGAQQHPMSVPVLARDTDEYHRYRDLPHVEATVALAQAADLSVVGIGQLSSNAPLYVDGFITADDLETLRAAGAAGEIAGHIFDAEGHYLDHEINRRMLSVVVPPNQSPVLCIGGGPSKIKPLRAALAGSLINILITDEDTARALLTA